MTAVLASPARFERATFRFKFLQACQRRFPLHMPPAYFIIKLFHPFQRNEYHYKAVSLVPKERISLKKALALMQVLFLARPARFERATFRLGGGRSILLSYGDIYQQLFYLIFEKESITLCGRDEIYLGDGAGY